MSGQTQLSNEEDFERGLERACDLVPDGNAAARLLDDPRTAARRPTPWPARSFVGMECK
jgi:hypothetical protein